VDAPLLTDTPHVATLTRDGIRSRRWSWVCTGCSRECRRTGHHPDARAALRCAADRHGDGPVIALDDLLGVYRADDQPVIR
jgi:hypothetical protein